MSAAKAPQGRRSGLSTNDTDHPDDALGRTVEVAQGVPVAIRPRQSNACLGAPFPSRPVVRGRTGHRAGTTRCRPARSSRSRRRPVDHRPGDPRSRARRQAAHPLRAARDSDRGRLIREQLRREGSRPGAAGRRSTKSMSASKHPSRIGAHISGTGPPGPLSSSRGPHTGAAWNGGRTLERLEDLVRLRLMLMLRRRRAGYSKPACRGSGGYGQH
jgi:hypothetical protein